MRRAAGIIKDASDSPDHGSKLDFLDELLYIVLSQMTTASSFARVHDCPKGRSTAPCNPHGCNGHHNCSCGSDGAVPAGRRYSFHVNALEHGPQTSLDMRLRFDRCLAATTLPISPLSL